MVRAIFFSLTVVFVNSALAQVACFDVFSEQTPPVFAEQRSIAEPWDLPDTGLFISGKNHAGLRDVVALLQGRDGTYPLLIDDQKNIIIENRLPNPNVAPNVPYLATHRGLYARLYRLTEHRPRIVFAGQIRVVGGVAINLIDQAGTFFQGIEDFSASADPMAALIDANQWRLDWAAQYLRGLNMIADATQIINFRKQFRNYGSSLLNEGHMTARQVADFEKLCHRDTQCFLNAQFVDGYLRRVMAQGGRQYMMDNMTAFMKKSPEDAPKFIQWMSMLLGEGTYGVMAGADLLNPNSPRRADFTLFLVDLPYFLD